MLRNNHPGGPNTSYTNQACNPYTDVAAIQVLPLPPGEVCLKRF